MERGSVLRCAVAGKPAYQRSDQDAPVNGP